MYTFAVRAQCAVCHAKLTINERLALLLKLLDSL